MPELRSETGQLLLPMLAVFLLFGFFLMAYVRWCRTIYWKMRMSMAADMTALSASRTQAALLNQMAEYQLLENRFMQKAKVFSSNVAHMQVQDRAGFEIMNSFLKAFSKKFKTEVLETAEVAAHANGADEIPHLPWSMLGHRLKAQSVRVIYFAGAVPKGQRNYSTAYFARGNHWFPRKLKPQPPHASRWVLCRGGVCEEGRARLWLDVLPSDPLDNGGFPSEQASWLRNIGIQCFYPQFNARLLPKR